MSSSQNNWNLDVFKEIVALSSTCDENARIALINALPDETLICLVEMVYNILNGSVKLSKPHIQRLKPHSEDLRHLSNIRNIDEARSFLVQTGGAPVAILFPILVSATTAILEHVLR